LYPQPRRLRETAQYRHGNNLGYEIADILQSMPQPGNNSAGTTLTVKIRYSDETQKNNDPIQGEISCNKSYVDLLEMPEKISTGDYDKTKIWQ
jgi:hypothetical protein